jgi:hypothetical protein
MTDNEEITLIEKIFDGTYINPSFIHSVFPAYKVTEAQKRNKFIFYISHQYDDPIESIGFKTKKATEEARKRLISIIHNHRSSKNDR